MKSTLAYHSATMHSVTDRETDRHTNRRNYHASRRTPILLRAAVAYDRLKTRLMQEEKKCRTPWKHWGCINWKRYDGLGVPIHQSLCERNNALGPRNRYISFCFL